MCTATRTLSSTPVLVLVFASALAAQVKDYKPSRLNLFSPDQDVQLGKESAAEVRKTMPVVNNADLTGYVSRIGSRLAKSKRAGGYPFTFEVINDPSINAFALPGGPMFVHTGLLASLDNETQLAGVLAHEMSHVALRHGTSNVTKANLIQLPALLGAQAAGSKGGILGTLAQVGIGLGAQSALLKYSRSAEQDADLNGAQIMNDAGYDPTQMAVFFEKLQTQGGTSSDNGRLANFLSDHPTPGNRVKYVTDQNKKLPKVSYSESEPSTLPRVKQIVASLPPPPKPVQVATNGQGQASAPSANTRPSGQFKTHQSHDFSINYPDNWDLLGDANAVTITVAPKATLVQNAQGQVQVGYGYITAYYFPQDKKPNLQRDTADLLKQMQSSNANMRTTGASKAVKVGGQNALLTPMESPSPYGNVKEIDVLLTIARPDGLFYTVFIAPESEWSPTQKTFDAIVTSIRFAQ
ncbi:MAG: M48 family metallopeptidase [Acidobacteriota bacterium]